MKQPIAFNRTRILILLAALLFCVKPALAEVPPPPVAAAPAPAQDGSVDPLASSPVLSSPENVTLDFKDADIRNVLRIISLKSGVNIVAATEVQGPVTIRLVDVPWEKALEVVLKTYGFAYERDGKIIRVTTVGSLSQEPLETQVFPLTYANAVQVQTTLQEMLSDRGSIRADERTNVLIVTDVPTNIYKIRQILSRLDRGTPQVLIEAKIVEMSLDEASKKGVKWNPSLELRGSSRPTTFPWDFTRAEENFFRYFPRGKPGDTQVLITDTGQTGAVLEEADSFPTQTRANRATPAPTFPFASTDDFTFGKIDFSQFQVLLEAIENSKNNKILSEPRITVLSNQEAKILVGEELYIPNYERNSDTGQMEITGYVPRSIGIELKVTPQINQMKQVNVNLAPSISSLLGFEELTPDVKVPRIAVRNASTQVRINSGETLVLGGLIKENAVDDVTKFPILGDLPGLKELFSHRAKTVTKTDLTFFITVTVLDEPNVIGVYDDAKITG